MTINQLVSGASPKESRLDRIGQSLERSTNLLERVIQVQETMLGTQTQQQTVINELVRSQRRQDVMIERLDAILERMIYREGRDGENP